MQNGILKLLLNKPIFAIDPQVGAQMLTYVLHRIKEGQSIDVAEIGFSQDNDDPEKFSGKASVENGNLIEYPYEEQTDPEKTVFTYRIHGTMMAQDQFCGPRGYNSMSRHMRDMAHSKDFSAVVLDFQTPGGQVMGNEGFVQAIKYLAERKPVVGFVNGMTASAGYKAIIQTNHVMASGAEAEIGSIGTLIAYYDFTEYMKQKGIRPITIVSNLSPNKAKFNYSNPSEEDIQMIRSEGLDPITELFHQSVRDARPGVSEDALLGDIFLASDAKEMDLIDSIGSYPEAIALAASLAASQKKKSIMFGKPTQKKAEGETMLVSEHEDKIAEMTAQHEQAINDLKAQHEQELKSLEEKQTALDEKVSALEEKVEKLEKTPVEKVKGTEGDEGAAKSEDEGKAPWSGFGEERRARIRAARRGKL